MKTKQIERYTRKFNLDKDKGVWEIQQEADAAIDPIQQKILAYLDSVGYLVSTSKKLGLSGGLPKHSLGGTYTEYSLCSSSDLDLNFLMANTSPPSFVNFYRSSWGPINLRIEHFGEKPAELENILLAEGFQKEAGER